MAIRLRELAELVGGELNGDGNLEISGAATIRDAQPGDITLADGIKFVSQLEACPATAVIVPLNVHVALKPSIRVASVTMAFRKIIEFLQPPRKATARGVSPAAHIAESARLAEDVVVFPQVYVGEDVEIGSGSVIHPGVKIMPGCRLGRNVIVFPNAVLYDDTFVGDRCVIHANAVIGAYGFGYQTVNGKHELSAQLGNVRLESDVEIGACATIDRGTYGSTVIGEGTKIDNQVMVAHNCRIGRHNLLCSQVGIAGSCTTGDYVVMAGQVGIRDHTAIGDRVVLGAKAGIMRDVPSDSRYFGIPATPEREQLQIMAVVTKLPEMRRQLRALEQQVAAMTKPATTGAASRPQKEAA